MISVQEYEKRLKEKLDTMSAVELIDHSKRLGFSVVGAPRAKKYSPTSRCSFPRRKGAGTHVPITAKSREILRRHELALAKL